MEISRLTVQLLLVAVPLVNGIIGALVARGATALAHRYTEAREVRKRAADAALQYFRMTKGHWCS